SVLENLYTHHGTQGHEIVFVFETAFAKADAYRRNNFQFRDAGVDNTARWIDLARFRSGQEKLFPAGLIEVVRPDCTGITPRRASGRGALARRRRRRARGSWRRG